MKKLELLKKGRTQPIDDRYTIPTTAKQKRDLDALKKPPYSLDVNEIIRRFADQLISTAQSEDQSA
jgi:hypothetical protein